MDDQRDCADVYGRIVFLGRLRISPAVLRHELGHKDGLPSTTVYSITQTTDGFLWIGTGDGLIRFDGFQFIQPGLPGMGLGSLGQVTALASIKSDDVLLVGTGTGLLVSWSGSLQVSTMLGSPVEPFWRS